MPLLHPTPCCYSSGGAVASLTSLPLRRFKPRRPSFSAPAKSRRFSTSRVCSRSRHAGNASDGSVMVSEREAPSNGHRATSPRQACSCTGTCQLDVRCYGDCVAHTDALILHTIRPSNPSPCRCQSARTFAASAWAARSMPCCSAAARRTTSTVSSSGCLRVARAAARPAALASLPGRYPKRICHPATTKMSRGPRSQTASW